MSATPHPLDRPVWHALTGRQAALAIGGTDALRFDPDHAPFAAAADTSPRSLAALAALVPADAPLWVVERDPVAPPPGLVAAVHAVDQMVADAMPPPDDRIAVVALGDGDAVEMRALAELTRPGPFLPRTHRLGRFVGVRDGGRLIAMAGERMKPGPFTELSGVCTHPDRRGGGLAGALMRHVGHAMLARGETPFLHVYPDNRGAIALYETLGFRRRATLALTVLTRAP